MGADSWDSFFDGDLGSGGLINLHGRPREKLLLEAVQKLNSQIAKDLYRVDQGAQ